MCVCVCRSLGSEHIVKERRGVSAITRDDLLQQKIACGIQVGEGGGSRCVGENVCVGGSEFMMPSVLARVSSYLLPEQNVLF